MDDRNENRVSSSDTASPAQADRSNPLEGDKHRVRLEPSGFYRRVPLEPHQLIAPVTPAADTIVLCHLGVPQLDAASWRLVVDGLVERPVSFGMDTLARYPFVEVEAVHQCAGSPLQPRTPTRRVSNVVWGGIRLVDILRDCGPKPEARFAWSCGADWGTFDAVAVDAYQKDLPLARLPDDVLIAFEMNGEPLRAENGFPARLVVPGFFGTNSTKWLQRITLADRRADGPFVTRWYNDPVLDDTGLETGANEPVWSLHPEAVIVAPAPGSRHKVGVGVEIVGWAWADAEITEVAILADGLHWMPATVDARRQRSWQRFAGVWTPQRAGAQEICVRATDGCGRSQPATGWRNAVHSVRVVVDDAAPGRDIQTT